MTPQQQAKARQKAEEIWERCQEAIKGRQQLHAGYSLTAKECKDEMIANIQWGIEDLALNNPDEWGLVDKSKCCVWVKMESDLDFPPEGQIVLFDGDEIPPVWGWIETVNNQKLLACYESSGEKEYCKALDYKRWLCEQPQLTETDKDKEIERLKGLIEVAWLEDPKENTIESYQQFKTENGL